MSPQHIPDMTSRSFNLIDKSLCWLMIKTNGSQYYEMNGFSGSIFTDALHSVEKGTGFIYYFSGINMKNTMAVPEIVNALDEALKKNQALCALIIFQPIQVLTMAIMKKSSWSTLVSEIHNTWITIHTMRAAPGINPA